MTRPSARFLLALLVLLALVACGEPGEDVGTRREVRFPVAYDISTLDFPRATDTTTRQLHGLVCDSLLRLDARLRFVPRLARTWEWSDDHLAITFHLRGDARWQDGRPVTAADVARTLAVLRDPGRTSADQVQAYAAIRAVETPDERTVVVRFREPNASALYLFLAPLLPPGGPPAPGELPVGCGPWKLVRWEKDQRLVLAANRDYWDGPPGVDRLVIEVLRDYGTRLNALEAGRIDWTGLFPEQWERLKDDTSFRDRFDILEGRILFYWYIAWRMDGSNPFFADARVRRAMTLAIDRQRYVETIGRGQAEVAVTSFHPEMACFDRTLRPLPFDPARARALLAEAGWVDRDGDGVREKDGIPFRFRLLYPATTRQNDRIAAFVQANLRDVGVAMELDPRPWAAFLEEVHGRKFTAVMSGYRLDPDPDPWALWHSSQADEGYNYAGLRDPEIDRWIEEARRTFDGAAREELYRKIQRRLHELQPDTFFFYPVTRYAVRRGLRGFVPSPIGPVSAWPGPFAWRWESAGKR